LTETSTSTAVIRAEPDGYDMGKTKLMGRQAAGHGFLRAAVMGRGEHPIFGYTPSQGSARGFERIVGEIDPTARFQWMPADQLERLGEVGVLYLADITVATHARLRLRAGVGAFSLCGVTHTTASAGAMDEIVGLLREPVAPWDALVCTSTSVVETVRRIHEAEADYLRWRLGPEVRIQGPQLPLIPLGVHCDDFEIMPEARAEARAELGLDDDVMVGLFVGRLVFHAKAHPFPMFRGFQLAAERTGRKLALILSGWFPNKGVEDAFIQGAAQFAPDVQLIVLEGREAAAKARAWGAADLFVSLSDNIQETFGLTPVEAMAAGLPLVVSDWNGYRDTVRDGIDGVRVPTAAPALGGGQALVRALETGGFNYDQYCWATAATISVDIEGVAAAVAAMAVSPDLRRRMGEAGRQRARDVYDWPVVYRQYQALWAELNARRKADTANPEIAARLKAAPTSGASRLDPFNAFGHYATRALGPSARLELIPGADSQTLRAILNHGLFSALSSPHDHMERAFAAIAAQPGLTARDCATAIGVPVPGTIRAIGLLMKVGLVRRV
jgi:glycosyltransferase involved in cell wall biosynthesis